MGVTEGISGETIARTFARFVAGLRYEDIPKPTLDMAKSLVLDQLACELIGSTLPWTEPALRMAELTQGAKPESTVVNHPLRVLAADAAFVNATFGQACELDDSAGGAAGHIGTATIPVAMAMGEREHINGRALLVAIVAGYEIMYRLMRSIRPHHGTRGFSSQGVGGPFAGASAAGKILGLTEDQMVHALAIAGSHASGSFEYDQSGGEIKRVHAGIAARGGIQSALLAGFGLTGPATIIEGKRGFCNIFATQHDMSRLTEKMGEEFCIHNVSFKMYPAIGAVHTPIAATESLVRQHGFTARDVVRIQVALQEKAILHGAGIRVPDDLVGAQFSLAFSVALAIHKRSNDLKQYMDQRNWRDPDMVHLMECVEVSADPTAKGEEDKKATVTITLRDGQTLTATEISYKGTRRNPATKAELTAKARGLAASVLTPAQIDTLVDTIEHLEGVEDVAVLPRFLVGDVQRS